MSMRYQNKTIELTDTVAVEEAEELLALLQKYPTAKLDLKACTHLHAACLQVLMATRMTVKTWPQEPKLATWLRSALN